MNKPEYVNDSVSTTDGRKPSISSRPMFTDRTLKLYRIQHDLNTLNIKGIWRHFALGLAELIEYEFPEALDGADIILSAAMPCAETTGTPGNSEWMRTVFRVRRRGDELWIGCENPRDNKADQMPKAIQSPMSDNETSGLSIGTGVNFVQVVTGSSVPVDNLYFIPTSKDCDDDWWELNGFNLCGALIGTLHDLSDTNSYWHSHMKHGYSNDTGGVISYSSNDTGGVSYSDSIST